MQRVAVAMSGGVDSSVAALLLKNSGYEVIGLTMCFNLPETGTKRERCCGLKGIEDARRVCHKLGIRHYLLNMKKAMEEKVIRDFCLEYSKGRTPNPCIRCNQYIKFGELLKKIRLLDADYLATGHYARIARLKASGHRPGALVLKKAKDKFKDQSYFLYRLGPNQMKRILFPLASYTKKQVRRIAKEAGLAVADKKGSQEICFLPDHDYRFFLKERLKNLIRPGRIVDMKGKDLGAHCGIAFYTVGQRGGLGVAMGWPAYIVGIDARKNRITLGRREDALKKNFLIRHPYFNLKPVHKKFALKVKIRYNHRERVAWLEPKKEGVLVSFKRPQFAITPGQAAVFYDQDKVIGGGIIGKVF